MLRFQVLSPPTGNEKAEDQSPPNEDGSAPHPRKHNPLIRSERSNSGFMRNRHSMRVGSSANPLSAYPQPVSHFI